MIAVPNLSFQVIYLSFLVFISLSSIFPIHICFVVNPFTPMSDQDRISPYNINTISTRLVMRIKKNITLGIIS